jgi:hypothetical protein
MEYTRPDVVPRAFCLLYTNLIGQFSLRDRHNLHQTICPTMTYCVMTKSGFLPNNGKNQPPVHFVAIGVPLDKRAVLLKRSLRQRINYSPFGIVSYLFKGM